MKIKNIIFDLGGVLLNLDIGRTDAAFAALVGSREVFRKLYTRLIEERFLENFETNAVDAETFTKKMQQINPHSVTTTQVHTAWSAMLLDFPPQRLQLLRQLREAGYKLYLLSNINTIHLRDVYEIIKETHGLGADEFDALFDKAYYSHLIGRRKPDTATYQYVIDHAELRPEETIFFDDNPHNILGAQRAGLLAQLHPANGNIAQTVAQFLQF
jgi:FMN phosphatase YigB (HAD superfamily)